MLHLRGGIKINEVPLTAEDVDRLADLDSASEQGKEAALVLERIQSTAETIVKAGLHGQLALAMLSAYEVDAIANAINAEKKRDRETLAALIGLALGRPQAFDMLPEDDVTEEIKLKFALAKRGRAILAGHGGGESIGVTEHANGVGASDQGRVGGHDVANSD